jgi:hypothetical protein
MTSIRFGHFGRSILSFLRRDSGSALFFFLIAVVLRAIPELLVPSYPVGYETITYYAPAVRIFSQRSIFNVFADAFQLSKFTNIYKPLLDTFRAGPLFYVIAWVVPFANNADVYIMLKVVGPLLYGFLSISFLIFLRRGLNLEWRMAFVATLVLVFQPVALRESWDRFRVVLGLVFLFFTLTAFRSNSRNKWWLVGILGALAALSREYIAILLFVTILGFVVLDRRNRLVTLAALTPAFVIFGVMSFPSWSWWNFVSPENPFARNYSWMIQDVLFIFLVCYLPLLAFVFKGFWRDKLLDPMICCLLVGSFSVITNPWFAVPGYQRWLMLLVFPFCVYVVKGFERWHLFDRNRIWMLRVIVLVFIIIGAGYSTGAFSYVGILPNSYVAVSLVQSSIPWSQVDDVKSALTWLDGNAQTNSCLLAREPFYGWTLNYLSRADSDVTVFPYSASSSSPLPALEKALDNGFRCIYLISYTNSDLNDFEALHSNRDISVFQYAPHTSRA